MNGRLVRIEYLPVDRDFAMKNSRGVRYGSVRWYGDFESIIQMEFFPKNYSQKCLHSQSQQTCWKITLISCQSDLR